MPQEIAFDKDNVGLLVGDPEADVHKVMLTLDVTTKVIEEAVRENANLIVAHHPIIFSALKKITADNVKGNQLLLLNKKGISVICAHTNCDFAENGLNDYLAVVLGLTRIEKVGEGGLQDKIRIGRLTEKIHVEKLVDKVKDRLQTDCVRLIGNGCKEAEKVAVYTGRSDAKMIIKHKDDFDVMVCGEIDYHEALEFEEENITAIDAGHFSTEWIFVYLMQNLLKMNFYNLPAIITTQHKNPFHYV